MSEPKLRVLLIEDNAPDARAVRERLTHDAAPPCDCVCVSRLSAALERVGQEHFDVVLLDLALPDSTDPPGMLRAIQDACDTPVIVLTGASDSTAAAGLLRLGAQDYLLKHQVDAERLAHSIRYALARYASMASRGERDWMEREVLALEHIVGSSAAPATERSMGTRPLREVHRGEFEACVEAYVHMLDAALEAAAFKNMRSPSDALRELAYTLGRLHAGPRDVIDVHTAALAKLRAGKSLQLREAYMSESRLAVLELMGRLVSFYRSSAYITRHGVETSGS